MQRNKVFKLITNYGWIISFWGRGDLATAQFFLHTDTQGRWDFSRDNKGYMIWNHPSMIFSLAYEWCRNFSRKLPTPPPLSLSPLPFSKDHVRQLSWRWGPGPASLPACERYLREWASSKATQGRLHKPQYSRSSVFRQFHKLNSICTIHFRQWYNFHWRD